MPRHLTRKVDDLNRLKTASRTASMISADSSPESGSFLTALEYLHEILIKPLLEDSLISATQHQTLVFIPCEVRIQNHQRALASGSWYVSSNLEKNDYKQLLTGTLMYITPDFFWTLRLNRCKECENHLWPAVLNLDSRSDNDFGNSTLNWIGSGSL